MEYPKIMLLILLAVLVEKIVADDTNTTDIPTTTPEEDSDRSNLPNTYAFSFETENGQVRDENIELDPASASSPSKMEVKGSYSFISADGYEYTVLYKANKKGYQPFVTAHKIITDKDTKV